MDEQCYNRLQELCDQWMSSRKTYEECYATALENCALDLNRIIDDETNSNV